jgi:hypothetical protein
MANKESVRRCSECRWAVERPLSPSEKAAKQPQTYFCHGVPPSATTLNGMITTSWPIVHDESDDWCAVFKTKIR